MAQIRPGELRDAGFSGLYSSLAWIHSYDARAEQRVAPCLSKIADLHYRGLLDDAEFAAAKAKILGEDG